MAKTKSFAEKMLKSGKPKLEFDCYKVINAKLTPAGTVRYESHIVKVKKDQDEKTALGL